ncbi:MAG: hypothetical protein ACKERG_04260 [Candidatus Hodgkinia cicadicola]
MRSGRGRLVFSSSSSFGPPPGRRITKKDEDAEYAAKRELKFVTEKLCIASVQFAQKGAVKTTRKAEQLGACVFTSRGVSDIETRTNSVIGVVLTNGRKILSSTSFWQHSYEQTVGFAQQKCKRSACSGIRVERELASAQNVGVVFRVLGWPTSSYDSWKGARKCTEGS